MHDILKHEFGMVRIELLRRKYFNESNGLDTIRRLGQKESLTKLLLGSEHYLCVSAAACLLKYIEHIQCITFAPHSIKISHRSLKGHMAISPSSLFSLEIVAGIKKAKKSKRSFGSLLTSIDNCKTPGGSRLLRSSLLQPLTNVMLLDARFGSASSLVTYMYPSIHCKA